MFDINISNNMSFIQLSVNFLNSIKGLSKIGMESESYAEILKSADPDELESELSTDNKRLAFWLNIYNAYVQLVLRQKPELYIRRSSFFSSKQIWIAGKRISLDLIEHGILRRSKFKYSMGYLNRFFPSAFETRFRLKQVDYRIHFALNCGAKSCPIIVAYDSDKIYEQLNAATRDYLSNEVNYDAALNYAELPALFLWFRNDFGGGDGINKILKRYSVITNEREPELHYKKYDWSLYLDNIK
ncbi:Protein of unknown function, DUF547 [Daejeonella rubra]|uniref:DUF547 domain-containing protein n=2 Tax=Daejeonella rubra TaxID=990371 RepID=A0A1G9QNI7_9SPHI|nr:Protein of unknown function, DUF547 [Daejeonella rubra]